MNETHSINAMRAYKIILAVKNCMVEELGEWTAIAVRPEMAMSRLAARTLTHTALQASKVLPGPLKYWIKFLQSI